MRRRAARELVEFALHNDAEQVRRPKKKKVVEEKEVVFSDEETDAKKVKTDEKMDAKT